MKKQAIFYIHINSDTLADYLLRGVFCPSRFLNNKNRDIQNLYDSFLLLSDKKWNAESDCSIEIILVEDDIAKLIQLQNHYFVFADCLPISRLKKIHFADKRKAKNVIWNINQGAAFVPEWAISYEYKSKPETVALKGKHGFPESYSEQNIKTKLERYDRLMGGLAFMNIGLLNSTFNNLDTTINYLSAAAYFNSQIANEIKNEKIIINSDVQTIFSGKNEIFKYLAKPITIDEVSEMGKKENQKVEKKFNAIKFESLDPKSLTYKLAILHTYGKGKVKSDNDFVSGLLSMTKSKLVEELALVFGLHTGYTSLRNSYSNSNGKMAIKFKLDTKLEFYLVESLFNYAFKEHKISSQIDFLSNFPQENKTTKTANTFNHLRLLGGNYTYKKQERNILEKDSLTSLLLSTVKSWCQKNNARVNEEQLLTKLGNSIIPEIRTTITSSKIDVKFEEPSISTNSVSDIKVNTEIKVEKEISKSNRKISSNKQKAITIKEPSLFPELQSNEYEQKIKDDNDLTIAQLEKFSVLELKALCKEKDYKGYSKFNREDLVKFILSQ